MSNPLRSLARAIVPAPARRALRRRHQQWTFRRALARFREQPRAAADDPELLAALVYGWGNAGWSADTTYLAACLREAADATDPIFECGSGLSTVLVGLVLQPRGIELHAFEHYPAWAERVQAELDRLELSNVTLHVAPLRAYDGFDWYDPDLAALPAKAGVVICDGPPADTRGGRTGLLPVLRDRLAPGTLLLIDDVVRDAERQMAASWAEALSGHVEWSPSGEPFARVRVG